MYYDCITQYGIENVISRIVYNMFCSWKAISQARTDWYPAL